MPVRATRELPAGLAAFFRIDSKRRPRKRRRFAADPRP
jgi:hypothetical protein